MTTLSTGFPRFWRWPAAFSLLFLCATLLFSEEGRVRYLRYADVAETLRLFAGSELPESDLASPGAWDRWIRKRDSEVRARIERGEEDSISNLILYGTSYTSLARLDDPESAVMENGKIAETARARVQALVAALRAPTTNERLLIVQDFLKHKGIGTDRARQFLTGNLERFAAEQLAYQRKLQQANSSRDIDQVLSARGTLYKARGLSVDTSLLTNYALEGTLRTLSETGALSEGRIRRVAVIGPGLDFTNKHGGYDFYPLQTIQPFAVMESVLRLKLGKPGEIEVVTMDLNPEVNAHVARLAREARAGRVYTLQLPRDPSEDWTPAAIAYWQHFGEVLGSEVKPRAVPQALEGVVVRAVSIAPQFASRIRPLDLNVVAQTADLQNDQAFDLVIATNILVYYDRFEQGLAMASIARMMNHGGVFLSNDALSSYHVQALKFLLRHSVAFDSRDSRGDNMLVYVRQ